MRVAAVDLGATSARVAVVDSERPDEVTIVHRYPHSPVQHADGSLRWDWDGLVREVVSGLEQALATGPLDSIGVDTWGVDYGLLDGDGNLVAQPHAYRDERTHGWQTVLDRLGEKRLYMDAGVQLMPINTIFQLAAHDRVEINRASHLLLLPELLVHHLTGVMTGEVTSAGTTGLVSLRTDDWDDELLDEIDVPRALFPVIASAGTHVGEWRGVPVHLVGGHDTASAVHARPGAGSEHRAFVSTGSWVLVGVERDEPLTNRVARIANFSNERSVDGRYRFLKNVTGLFLLEQCREAWGGVAMSELLAAAEKARGGLVINVDDPELLDGESLPKAISVRCELDADDRGGITRCLLDSIAAATAGVISQLGMVTGNPITEIDLLGGGAQIPLLVSLIGDATGLPCIVGSAEATALGNAKAQFAALG